MSRYFNELKKAEQWSEQETSRNLDLEQIVQNVRQAEGISEDLADTRLGSARVLTLPEKCHAPLLTRNDDQVGVAAESYRMLRTRLLRIQAAQGLRSIVMSSALPGEGKTLTTLNLALCCTQIPNARVLVVDADFRTRGLTRLIGDPSGPGLSEILSEQAAFEEAVHAVGQSNLSVIGVGGATRLPAEAFSTQRWKDFVGWASETFKLVLIDSPPILPLADFELISAACDGVMMVVRAGVTQREILRKAASQVDSRKLLGSIFNVTQADQHAGYPGYSLQPRSASNGARQK